MPVAIERGQLTVLLKIFTVCRHIIESRFSVTEAQVHQAASVIDTNQ
ncbi:hypothetical protein [Photobacterium salinisoli]